MSTLSKNIMVDVLVTDLGLARSDAKYLVDEFFSEIKLILESGQDIKLSGFGNFVLRDKPERPGRNPKTGELVPIAARRVVTFKPGLKLKKAIEEKNS